MKHQTKIATYSTVTLGLAAALAFSVAVPTSVNGQQKSKTPASETNRGGRDPFSKYVPPRVVTKKSNLVMPPSIQERIQQYKAQKQAAMSARVAAPKPTTAFLLSEVQVIGISRSPRGYAAIVEASPIKLAYVIYPGERFYDGQLVAIEDNRLVFRRETVFSDGRHERSVELKPLRQPDAIDALAAAKTTPDASAGDKEKKLEEKPTVQKPE